MNKYEVIKTIGEGAYGVVLQCRNKETGELVAIKRFKESDEDELVRKTTLREVKILRLLKEETHVVHLLEAFRRKGKLYLVFEYVGCNLLDVLEQHPQGLEMEDVRRMIFTLMLGVRACHCNSVIHRDIKPENLLLHPDNTLRLCDFGFARIYNTSMNDLTDYVATRWYRSPELLLGTTDYGLASDMWAIGCIMAEMIDGQALFPGESELDQIFMIQKLLGNFTPSQQEVFRKNKRFANETLRDVAKPDSSLERKYGRKANKKAIHFLKSLLVIDPEKRLTVDEAINHPFFEGMVDVYAPQLKLITPLIRPSTATRAYNAMQQQPHGTSNFLGQQASSSAVKAPVEDVPPRPASTTLEPTVQTSVNAPPQVMMQTLQQQQQAPAGQQLSSRVSQASSTQSLPNQSTIGAAKSGAPSNSFLPSRIGSGHRRPPSQQQGRAKDDPVSTLQTSPQDHYQSVQVAPSAQSRTSATPQYSYNVAPQQQLQQQSSQQPNHYNQPSYTSMMTTNINPNINPASYAAFNARGNLPKLGQMSTGLPVPQGNAPNAYGAPTGGGGPTTYGRLNVGGPSFVNGGSNPARDGGGSSAGPAMAGSYKPPPSQQSRSRFFYS